MFQSEPFLIDQHFNIDIKQKAPEHFQEFSHPTSHLFVQDILGKQERAKNPGRSPMNVEPNQISNRGSIEDTKEGIPAAGRMNRFATQSDFDLRVWHISGLSGESQFVSSSACNDSSAVELERFSVPSHVRDSNYSDENDRGNLAYKDGEVSVVVWQVVVVLHLILINFSVFNDALILYESHKKFNFITYQKYLNLE